MAAMPSSDALSQRLTAIPGPIKGALFMITAAFGFSIMNALVREVSSELHPFEIAFFRNVFALLFTLPWLLRVGAAGWKTTRPGLQLLRSVLGLAAMLTWFSSLALLPLAEATALNFTVPLFATLGAAIVLGESVRARRWSATVVGFLGVIVILRPGFAELQPEMALPIVAAVFMAGSVLTVKKLSSSDSPETVVFYMNLILTPLSFLPALFVWQWPSGDALLMMAGVGFVGSLSHLLLTRAYVHGDASAIIPFDYARLPFVAAIGFLFFDELPDLWTWVGAAVIAGSAIYIARREAQVARRHGAATPAIDTPKSLP